MAQPTSYTRETAFSAEETNAVGGRSTVRTAALDAELDAAALTIAETLTNLALIQRDDGKIRDQKVELHTLAPDVRAFITAGNGNPLGAWVTATVYAVRDLVSQGGVTYIAATAHTAGTFATDLAAGRWIQFAGSSAGAASVSFTPAAGLVSTNVQAAIEEIAADVAPLGADTGSFLVGYKSAGTNAVPTTVQGRLRRTIWADDFSTLEDALVYAASLGGAGRGVRLTGGKRYTRTTRLLMGAYNGCGLYCLEGTAELYFPAASFTNSTLSNRYAASSACVDISGELSGSFLRADGQFLIGLRLTSEVTDGRMVDAITARNTRNLRLEGLTFSGFPVGCDIRASTWDGGRIVHTRHLGRASTYVWPSQPQSTAIEFDNDRVNSTPSSDVQIDHPWGKDFTITGQSTSAWDDQTDFINIGHFGSAYFVITSPTARNFGEGLDMFGKNIQISNPSLNQMKTFAIKFVNGAKFCSVTGGGAEDVGRAGVVFAGSTAVGAGDTTRNTVTGFNVTNVDYQNRFSGGDGCVAIVDNGGTTGKPIGNSVIGGRHSLGTYGKYGWNDQSTGSGNISRDVEVTLSALSGARHALIINSASTVYPANATATRLHMGTAQSIPAAVDQLLLLDATTFDRRSEAQTASTTVTISNASPGVCTYSGADIFANGDPVILTTTGALPTGLAVDTTYFVANLNTTTKTFNVSATVGGGGINTSSAGSGVHTCRPGGVWICQVPGLYRVRARVRFATIGAAGVAVLMRIRKNGTDVALEPASSGAASDQSFEVDDLISCVAGDRLTAAINQASGATRSATALSAYTFMSVEAA